MIYPESIEQKIGFDQIREQLTLLCLSSLGQEKVEEMVFQTTEEPIRYQLSCVKEMMRMRALALPFPTDGFSDLRFALARIKPLNTYLIESELYDLKRTLHTFQALLVLLHTKEAEEEEATSYLFPNLQKLVAQKEGFIALTQQIDAVVDKYGNIKSTASKELHNIRRRLEALERSIATTMQSLMQRVQLEGYADKDAAPSLRDGRLVLPVTAMAKRKVKGIVHDESATGKTLYIEPQEVVETNNEIRSLQLAEKREIIKILQKLTEVIRPHIADLLTWYKILGDLDFIRAKALWAEEHQAGFPLFTTDTQLIWKKAYHPILRSSLKKSGKETIPLFISLHKEQHILLISGPNAGGKSVCLKTVGLLQYMWQCGLPVPMDERSTMGLFQHIYIDIGDEQNIENELSTYSSHLTNMRFMLRGGGEQTLLLIDEFGGGTEPTIGGAMAEAILTAFVKQGCYGVITTHYQNLKRFADHYSEVVNGAMLYDRQAMQPLYQLEMGRPGNSFALEIARKIGLPQEVIAHAQALVGDEYVQSEKYLQDIARDKRYWEEKRKRIRLREKQLDDLVSKHEQDIKGLEAKQKSILEKAKQEAENILKASNVQIEQTIKEIKEAQAEKGKTKLIREELAQFKTAIEKLHTGLSDEEIIKKMEQIKQRKKRKEEREKQHKEVAIAKPSKVKTSVQAVLKVGDYVQIKGQNVVGQLEKINQKQAFVRVGSMLTQVKLEQLTLGQSPARENTTLKAASTLSEVTRNEMHKKSLHFKQDLDVRGMRVEEALTAVAYFVDEALMVGVPKVRILHGTGTGALKEAIRKYLIAIPILKNVKEEHVQFGGAGITVVEF